MTNFQTWQICCQNSFWKSVSDKIANLTNHRITNSLTADLCAGKIQDFPNGFDSILLIPICWGITSRERELAADC